MMLFTLLRSKSIVFSKTWAVNLSYSLETNTSTYGLKEDCLWEKPGSPAVLCLRDEKVVANNYSK